jgi:two-component system, OmpR family, sensor histidine kinase KdpD
MSRDHRQSGHPCSAPAAAASKDAIRAISWQGYAVAVVAITVATFVGFLWRNLPDPRNLSLVFFAAILSTGVWGGLRPALAAAFLAFFSYNFFLIEPRFGFKLTPADILAFATFLGGGLLVGGLSGRLSDRARDATSRLRELTALFEASRDLSCALKPGDAAEHIVRHLEQNGCHAIVFLRQDEKLSIAASSKGLGDDARQAGADMTEFLRSSLSGDFKPERWLLRLETGERTLGGAAIWPRPVRNIGPGRQWVSVLLELGAVAIDRARLVAEVADAAIVAEKEGLRTALLSSLSHDLRTPIATILASASALQDHGDDFDAQTRHDILETIQDESERLNRYVANLLEMTRLESGALRVRSVLISPNEAMASALERVCSRLKGRRVLRAFSADSQRILVDPVLIEQALVNVLENAVSHSPPGSTVLVSTEREGDRFVMAVEDDGPGIPPSDLDRVFDKFFQGRSDRRRGAGVGLGLSVSRGLIEAFGGEVRAATPTSGRGARIEFRLPAHPAMEPVE